MKAVSFSKRKANFDCKLAETIETSFTTIRQRQLNTERNHAHSQTV